MDPLQIYSHLSLLTIAVSLLSILGLRTMTGLPLQRVELIREFRTSLEQTSRNCMRARSAALARNLKHTTTARAVEDQPSFYPYRKG